MRAVDAGPLQQGGGHGHRPRLLQPQPLRIVDDHHHPCLHYDHDAGVDHVDHHDHDAATDHDDHVDHHHHDPPHHHPHNGHDHRPRNDDHDHQHGHHHHRDNHAGDTLMHR